METSKNNAGPRINENGDDIVFEGIRDPKKLICFLVLIFSFMMIGSLGLGLLFLPCIISLNYCLFFRKWHLYITHSDLHYSIGFEYTIIPFSDINLISVVPGTNTVLVGRKHGQTVIHSNRGVLVTNELKISGVANCKEFVAAVKAEMACSQQQ